MSKLDHANIVKLHESIDTPKYVYLVMEYARGESLHAHLKSMPSRQFAEEKARRLIKQLLMALDYLHERHVAHRDIKLENIIIDHREHMKLIDFGFLAMIMAGVVALPMVPEGYGQGWAACGV